MRIFIFFFFTLDEKPPVHRTTRAFEVSHPEVRTCLNLSRAGLCELCLLSHGQRSQSSCLDPRGGWGKETDVPGGEGRGLGVSEPSALGL